MKMNVRFLSQSAVIAALYAVLTWVLAPISYGPIQFRISEILVLLVFFNPKYAYAIILGCFVANTTSSLGWYDMVFGTLATTLAVLPMLKCKRISIAGLFPVISNAIIISLELWLAFKEPGVLFYNMITIAIGEAVVIYGLGVPFYAGLCNNDALCELLEINNSKLKTKKVLSIEKCLYVVFGILNLIFYFALPISTDLTIISLTKENIWLIALPILGVISTILGIILKGKLRITLSFILLTGIFGMWLSVGIINKSSFTYIYYYVYLLIMIFNFIFILSTVKKEVTLNE